MFRNQKKDCYNCPYIDNHIKLDSKRRQYEQLLADSDYKDVKFDEKTGGVKATHINHIDHNNEKEQRFFGNLTSSDLENECQNILYKWGHTAILQNEFAKSNREQRPPSLDLELDGIIMDIRSITERGHYGNALKAKNKQLGNVKRKTGIDSDNVCLYFHDATMFSEEKLIHDMDWYKTNIVEIGSKQRIRHVYVVVKGESRLRKYDI